jgi:hypothetical protein
VIDTEIYCEICGRGWYPSKDASYTFPGSGCDTASCLCGPCEDGRECSFHRELSRQQREERARRAAAQRPRP